MKIKLKIKKLKIHFYLRLKGVKNYTINDDLTVDADGDVDLRFGWQFRWKQLPMQFGTVSGDFICIGIGLTTLKGCPSKVGKTFECHHNELTSLQYGPEEVGYDYCCDNNKLTSLEYCPKIIHGNFDCSFNRLTSLDFAPEIVKESFDCSYNELLANINEINFDVQGIFRHRTENPANKIRLVDGYYEPPYEEQNGMCYSYVQYYNLVLEKETLSKIKLHKTLNEEMTSKEINNRLVHKI